MITCLLSTFLQTAVKRAHSTWGHPVFLAAYQGPSFHSLIIVKTYKTHILPPSTVWFTVKRAHSTWGHPVFLAAYQGISTIPSFCSPIIVKTYKTHILPPLTVSNFRMYESYIRGRLLWQPGSYAARNTIYHFPVFCSPNHHINTSVSSVGGVPADLQKASTGGNVDHDYGIVIHMPENWTIWLARRDYIICLYLFTSTQQLLH